MADERIPLSPSLAVSQFLKSWGGDDGTYLAGDIATKLTCGEAEALADLLLAFGDEKASQDWLSAHSFGDECGDMHCFCGDCDPEEEEE